MTDVETVARALAEQFHEIYERLAPSFGYETRNETRQFDPSTPNGQLMIAVCGEIARATLAAQAKEQTEVAPHTVEDADDRTAYDLYVIAAKSGYPATWENRDRSELYLGFRAAIKRGRELEQDA